MGVLFDLNADCFVCNVCFIGSLSLLILLLLIAFCLLGLDLLCLVLLWDCVIVLFERGYLV